MADNISIIANKEPRRPPRILTQDEYLALAGVLAIAKHHNSVLRGLEAAACRITGDRPSSGSHTSDAIYCDYGIDSLLDKLNMSVEDGFITGLRKLL